MDNRAALERWIENALEPEEQRRFVAILRIEGSIGDEATVDRALPLKAARAAKDAACLIEALTGHLVGTRLYAESRYVCIRRASDDGLLPHSDPWVATFVHCLPTVQAYIDAWRDLAINPTDQSRDAFAAAERTFDPDSLNRIQAAILAIAKTKRKRMEFSSFDGAHARLEFPSKAQLLHINAPGNECDESDDYVIASIEPLTLVTNAAGTLYVIPSRNVGAHVLAGVTAQIIRARAPAPLRWRTVERAELPKGKAQKTGPP